MFATSSFLGSRGILLQQNLFSLQELFFVVFLLVLARVPSHTIVFVAESTLEPLWFRSYRHWLLDGGAVLPISSAAFGRSYRGLLLFLRHFEVDIFLAFMLSKLFNIESPPLLYEIFHHTRNVNNEILQWFPRFILETLPEHLDCVLVGISVVRMAATPFDVLQFFDDKHVSVLLCGCLVLLFLRLRTDFL